MTTPATQYKLAKNLSNWTIIDYWNQKDNEYDTKVYVIYVDSTYLYKSAMGCSHSIRAGSW